MRRARGTSNRRGRNMARQRSSVAALERANNSLLQIVALEKTQQDMSIPKVPDVPRLMLKRDKVYTFSRTFNYGTLNTVSVGYGFNNQVSLSAITGYTDFTNLFEQYRIVQTTVKFIPVVAGDTSTVLLYTWIDQDDGTPPTGVGEGMQNETFQISAPNKYFERTFTPHTAAPVFSTGSLFNAYAQSPQGQWLDSAYATAVYYGLKGYYDPTAYVPNNTPLYQVFQEVVIQCRRPN